MNTESQEQGILRYMQVGCSITPLAALQLFGCFRLGARIYDLKQKGHVIERKLVIRQGKRVASYRLASQ
jgi:hypothetical protein